jgi:hypothetical protein
LTNPVTLLRLGCAEMHFPGIRSSVAAKFDADEFFIGHVQQNRTHQFNETLQTGKRPVQGDRIGRIFAHVLGDWLLWAAFKNYKRKSEAIACARSCRSSWWGGGSEKNNRKKMEGRGGGEAQGVYDPPPKKKKNYKRSPNFLAAFFHGKSCFVNVGLGMPWAICFQKLICSPWAHS